MHPSCYEPRAKPSNQLDAAFRRISCTASVVIVAFSYAMNVKLQTYVIPAAFVHIHHIYIQKVGNNWKLQLTGSDSV